MKFSVVVPVYNVEQYLGQCLESLQAQDYTDFEVICVNDGSTDGSRKILTEWATHSPQMRIIDRENGGLSAARNTGLKEAKGDYVVFVDSDDWVEPTMLSRLAAECEGADMVCFACRRTDTNTNDILLTEQSAGWGAKSFSADFFTASLTSGESVKTLIPSLTGVSHAKTSPSSPSV